MEFKRVVNVIPFTRVNLAGTQFFTYLVPLALQGQIRPGQLVRAPFAGRNIAAVTSSFEMHRLEEETRGLKTILELVDAAPVLTDKQLLLADWLSSYYVCSLGVAGKAMLPPTVKNPKAPVGRGYDKFDPDFLLNEYQHRAVAQIGASLGKQAVFLLHGVTGSGKTEIYMQIIKRLVAAGKQTIMLVPEISLTAAAVDRFSRRFGPEAVAIWGSNLSPGERLWTWQKIRDKEKLIIIGPRSAIFSPVRDLGLVILDEEHDPSYKQYDQNPKYHAREVAKKLSGLWSCPLVLGDATPSVETYEQARRGVFKLLELPHRIKADIGMPKVKLVDMTRQDPGGEFRALGDVLRIAIEQALREKRQIILFVGRRGTSAFVMCRDCGHVPHCEACTVSLVWHQKAEKLICHHCGRKYDLYDKCPACGGSSVKYFGIGTEAVESELREFLAENMPKSGGPVIVRMDRDTTAARGGESEEIYTDWAAGKIDILIGTQMITKGWDISRVGLVGIVAADTLFNLPDFRANERAFQVLTQVAGRTGRGKDPGLVILQTFNPGNYAVQAARMHDYKNFFAAEIVEREKHGYPPFTRLVKLTVTHAASERAESQAREIFAKVSHLPLPYRDVLGPITPFISKVRGKHRRQIILKLPADRDIDLYTALKTLPAAVDIDVDPESLL